MRIPHAKEEDVGKAWRWVVAHLSIIIAITLILAIAAEWYLTTGIEETLGTKMTVDLAAGTIIHVQDIEIQAVRYHLARDSTRTEDVAIADECGQTYGELLTTPTGKGTYLKHDIMELEISGRGLVCLTVGQVIEIGDVRIASSEIDKPIANADATGLVAAEQIEIYRVLPKRNIYLTILLGALTLVVGSALGLWFEHQAKKYQLV